MPSLLFGSVPERVERGEFFCPECHTDRPYHRVVVRRALTLGRWRLLWWGRWGEYIECFECLATYRPEVLAYDAGDETAEVMAEYQQAVRRVLALMVATDGVIEDAEIQTVRTIFEAVSGGRLSRSDVLREVDEVTRTPTTVARYLSRVVGYLNDYGKEQVLRAARMVSRADGVVVASELHMMRRLGGVLHLSQKRVEALLREGEPAG